MRCRFGVVAVRRRGHIRAVFQVYDGYGTNSNLLTQISSSSSYQYAYSSGPYITIVFNADYYGDPASFYVYTCTWL